MSNLLTGDNLSKINLAISLLKKCDLFWQHNKHSKDTKGISSICRTKSYAEVWKFLLSESYFRILLKDSSFFIFGFDPMESDSDLFSMSYYGCPYVFPSLEEYIIQIYGMEYLDLKYDQSVCDEYQQALEDCEELPSPVMFRYDYNPEQYEAGRHPVSHMHIGFKNEIRLGCYRVLNPLSFVSFVVRQQYPHEWRNRAISSSGLFKASIRDTIPMIGTEFLSSHDVLEMYLGKL